MKTLILLSALLITLSQAFALTPEERMRERMRLHEEMHQKLRQSLLQGGDPTAAMNDMSRLMDSLMDDSLADMDHLSQKAPRFKSSPVMTEWSESTDGRSLLVKTTDKDTKLDVQVNNQVISIKTELAQKTARTQISGQSVLTQPVPPDCDGDAVKMEAKDSGLVLFFPFKGKASQDGNGRTPIQGNPKDIQT